MRLSTDHADPPEPGLRGAARSARLWQRVSARGRRRMAGGAGAGRGHEPPECDPIGPVTNDDQRTRKAVVVRTIGMLMIAGIAALALAACGNEEDSGRGEPLTLHAREVPAGAGHQEGPPTRGTGGAGPARDVLEPTPGTRVGQLVRIDGVRSEGDRLVLTVHVTDRARSAQSPQQGPTAPTTEPLGSTPAPGSGPIADEDDGGVAQRQQALPPGPFELPAAPDVTVTSEDSRSAGADAVKDAVERAADQGHARQWRATIRGGQVVELSAEATSDQ